MPSPAEFAAKGIGQAFRVAIERKSRDGMFRTSENWLCCFGDTLQVKPLVEAAITADVRHLLVVVFGSVTEEAEATLRESLAAEKVRVALLGGELAGALAEDYGGPGGRSRFSFRRLRQSIQEQVEAAPWRKRFQTASVQPMRVLPLSAQDAALAEADLLRALDGGSFLLLGEPGAGKTTSLLAMGGELAASGPYTPVFLPLGRYQGSFWSILCEALAPGGEPVPKRVAEDLLGSGILVLLLDGINEVQNPDLQAQLVGELDGLTSPGESSAQTRWVVSGRVHDYQQSHRPLAHLDARRWEMQRLTADLIYGFLAEALGKPQGLALYESLGQSLHEICANPLLLNMVLTVYREKGRAPSGRAALYRQFIDLLLGWGADGGLTAAEQAMAYEALTALATSMSTTMTQWGDARRAMAGALPAEQDATRLLEDLTRRGILVQGAFNRLSFLHHTFQEYFQARSLIGREVDELIPSTGVPAGRREAVAFLAGLLPDSTKLIRRAVEIDLQLAVELLCDAPQAVPVELAQQVAAEVLTKATTGTVFYGDNRRFAVLFRRVATLVGESVETLAAKVNAHLSQIKRTQQLMRFYAELGDPEGQQRSLAEVTKDQQVGGGAPGDSAGDGELFDVEVHSGARGARVAAAAER